MENEAPKKRDRFMKSFGFKPKANKLENEAATNVDDFLHRSSDNLTVTHAPPPPPPDLSQKPPRIDTTVPRHGVGMSQDRPMALGRPAVGKSIRRSPRPNKKGLLVRFVDTYPEVIGEGGDETELPTIEISKRKKAKQATSAPPPPPPHRTPVQSPFPTQGSDPFADQSSSPVDDFKPKALSRSQTGYSSIYTPENDNDAPPKPLSRSQTGFSSVYEPESDEEPQNSQAPALDLPQFNLAAASPDPSSRSPPASQDTLLPGRTSSSRYLESSPRHDEARRSFIEIHQAEMREAEGAAFAKAARTASAASNHNWADGRRPPSDIIESSPERTRQRQDSDPTNPSVQYSPAASIHSNDSDHTTSSNLLSVQSPPTSSLNRQFSVAVRQTERAQLPMRAASVRVRETVGSSAEDALEMFVSRTKHLFELFRLHAESVKHLSTSTPKDCARAGLWWFLKGRMGLESSIRERPSSPQSQLKNELSRQQAFTNLAKGYWLCDPIIIEISGSQTVQPDAETIEVSDSVISALSKLAMSMKRNQLMPPEDAFLPQTLDKSIWVEYPSLSQDMVALLSGNWGSGMSAMQTPMSTLHLLDAFPITDTPENFSYGRVMADLSLMEQGGRESEKLTFACMLSMVRPQKHSGLVFVIASQNGNVQLAIQENKNAGPVWDDVRWRNESCTLEVRLPRGFMIIIQLTQHDFRLLWNMYDFGSKVKSTLYPRKDEVVVFRNTLRSFQYMDADPNSRLFPKEVVNKCEVALFEKLLKEVGPSGTRIWHRGFRIAVVTGPQTKTVSGVHHTYPPYQPLQFSFFRAEGEAPALSLRFENGRQKGRMILTFSDQKERVRFHSLLTGTALNHDERIFTDVPLKGFIISQSLREPLGVSPFSRMPWKAARVVNEEFGPDGDQPPTVLADKLKVVLEYQNGTVTDRVNVGPGELRMRLEVTNAKLFRLWRQPQTDIGISVSESQVPKELPRNLSDALQLLKINQTIRTMEFETLKDLHNFQAAVTGFEVIFDGLAATLAISRRRMVVPIHKKWEAGFTRIQLVQQEDKLQILAFFEDFHHGHCMNWVLKGTDIYETFSRNGKAGIKFVDAKFPLPRLPAEKNGEYDEMAFVCLDLPDLPGEHDDIAILFENEEERDRLIELLPAPVKGSTRMSRLK
ncbi:unnamed protein product [Clonostachys byssicola]|uniref:Uncharacterized protein n=1 Tax=Clonostachys byssicola TaxID=160290 RepID=A0A9N9U404_9HYPO|nr:unnamed protein product [Clonostachys byssicola]